MTSHLQKTPLGALGWLASISLWMTWAPFRLRAGGAPELHLDPTFDLATASHLFLLIPIVVVLTTVTHGRGTRRSLVHLWGAVVLWGLFLEVGQWWIEGRGPSLYDMLANGLGAAFAIWGTGHLIRRGIGVHPIRVAVGMLVFTVILGITIYSAFQFQAATRNLKLAGWNPQRCAGKPPQEACETSVAGREARLWRRERAAASRYVEMPTQVWSITDMRRSLARNVTFSRGCALRNATPAPWAYHLTFRVRTPCSGSNVSHFAFGHGGGTIKAEPETGTVSATFQAIFHGKAFQMRAFRGVSVMWRGRAAGVGAVILSVSLGLAVGWLLCPRWTTAALTVSTVAVASLWAIRTWLLLMLAPGVTMYLLTTSAAVLGVGLAAWDWRRLWPQAGRRCSGHRQRRDRTTATFGMERSH